MTVVQWPKWKSDMIGLDVLHAAVVYLKNQFRYDMPREQAQANLEARKLMIDLSLNLCTELEERHRG